MPGDADIGTTTHLRDLRTRVHALADDVRRGGRAHLSESRDRLEDSSYRGCGSNLASYLDLRQHDVRALQDELALLGLSSLGRAEAHVRASLAAVETALDAFLGGRVSAERVGRIARLGARQADCLTRRTDAVFGLEPPRRRTRIMVTLPSEAATDPAVTHALVEAGMDVARVNGAHDGAQSWLAMAGHVPSAAHELGRDCKVQIDLPGIPTGPGRLRIRSADVDAQAATVVLDSSGALGSPAAGDDSTPRVAVPRDWLSIAAPGDVVQLVDARGRERTIRIEGAVGRRRHAWPGPQKPAAGAGRSTSVGGALNKPRRSSSVGGRFVA